ncbi:Pyrophosphatase PpaX [uncultured archaeon]|nr:Pyrophosphatase PpaX [uncultured archaeon]
MTLKAIVWDWEGTLVDEGEQLFQARKYVAESAQRIGYKTSFPYSNKQEMLEQMLPPKEEYEKFGFHFKTDVNTIKDLFAAGINNTPAKTYTFSKDLLEFTKQLGFINVLVSNKQKKYLEKEVQNQGLTQYFEVILGSGDFTKLKPDFEGIQKALDALRLMAEEIIIIGDSVGEIRMAKTHNAKIISVTWGLGKTNELKEEKASFYATNPQELKNVLTLIKKMDSLPQREAKPMKMNKDYTI